MHLVYIRQRLCIRVSIPQHFLNAAKGSPQYSGTRPILLSAWFVIRLTHTHTRRIEYEAKRKRVTKISWAQGGISC